MSVPQNQTPLSENPVPQPEEQPQPQKFSVAWALIVVAAIIAILAGIKAAQTIVAPFFLAVFFAVVLIPPLRWLKSKGFSDIMAFIIISSTVLVAGLLMIGILVRSVNMFVAKIPEYNAKITNVQRSIDTFLEGYDLSLLGGPKNKQTAKKTLSEENDPIIETEKTLQQETETEYLLESEPTDEFILPNENRTLADKKAIQAIQEEQSTFGILGIIRYSVTEMGKLASMALLVLVLVVFMILEAARLPKKIVEAFGPKGITNDKLENIADQIWRYMLIKGIISMFTGLFTLILLLIFRVEYAVLWGLLAFFLNFIPNIGSIIASVPPIALAFFDHGIGICFAVTIGLITINWIIGYYFEPKYLGDGLGISPLVVLLSLIFWGWLLGAIGMFLSAPLTIVVKIILQSFDDTRWVGTIMDDR